MHPSLSPLFLSPLNDAARSVAAISALTMVVHGLRVNRSRFYLAPILVFGWWLVCVTYVGRSVVAPHLVCVQGIGCLELTQAPPPPYPRARIGDLFCIHVKCSVDTTVLIMHLVGCLWVPQVPPASLSRHTRLRRKQLAVCVRSYVTVTHKNVG